MKFFSIVLYDWIYKQKKLNNNIEKIISRPISQTKPAECRNSCERIDLRKRAVKHRLGKKLSRPKFIQRGCRVHLRKNLGAKTFDEDEVQTPNPGFKPTPL